MAADIRAPELSNLTGKLLGIPPIAHGAPPPIGLTAPALSSSQTADRQTWGAPDRPMGAKMPTTPCASPASNHHGTCGIMELPQSAIPER
jgi:hypothetical protein